MTLSDKQVADLVDHGICPVCKQNERLDQVMSHASYAQGYGCPICLYISVPKAKMAFDSYIPPGCYFDSVH